MSSVQTEALRQEFSQEDRELLQRLLFRPLILPPDFKSWLYKFASGDAAPHFQELLGVKARRWRIAEPVLPLEYCNQTTYGDLATNGPELTGLENGQYMVMFGYYTQNGGSGSRYGRIEYNNQATDPGPSPETDVVIEGQAIMFHLVNLKKENNNSMKLRYRVPTSDAYFSNRWLHAVQVASA
jgi:hypothetical protein